MSKKICRDPGESSKQVKFRASGDTVDEFDAWVGESEYKSRAEALRGLMERSMKGGAGMGMPLEPPEDESLSKSYKRLVEVASSKGVIPHDVATSELSSLIGRQKKSVERSVLSKLRERGYLKQTANLYGDRAWTLRGWE